MDKNKKTISYLKQEDLERIAEEHSQWSSDDISKVIDENYQARENKNDYLTVSTPFKMVVAGPSNSGKTYSLLNLIYKGHIYFDTLTIVSSTAKEQSEKFSLLEDLAEIFPNKFRFMSKPSSVKFKDYNKDKVNVVIFDDLQEATKKEEIEAFINCYTLGRHHGISPIFLAQDYYKVPIRIRSNSSHYMFFKTTSQKAINRFHLDIASDLEKEAFYRIYKAATEPQMDVKEWPYLVVDTTQKAACLRYRRNFKELLLTDELQQLPIANEIV
jgi:hypothetical protein